LSFAFKDTFRDLFHTQNSSFNVRMLSNIVSGSLAGGTSIALLYPLDYARVRLIMDKQSAKLGDKKEFNGLIDVYRKTLALDGIRGLYRGFFISFLGIFVYRGLYFGLYDTFKKS
jgi:solute carrier family 25 (adenine nucleotide translocator) protein 4/5/6/31